MHASLNCSKLVSTWKQTRADLVELLRSVQTVQDVLTHIQNLQLLVVACITGVSVRTSEFHYSSVAWVTIHHHVSLVYRTKKEKG